MAERESLSSLAAAWAQVVSALVGVVAAGAAFFVGAQSIEQGDKQEEEARKQQTLQFFATFNSANMLQTREALDNEDWCARYGYARPLPEAAAIGRSQIVSMVDFFDAIHNTCPPSDQAQRQRRGFLERLVSADESEQGLCDRTFAEQLFSPYAADLYDDVAGEIMEIRKNRGENHRGENLGEGMRQLANISESTEEVAARYAHDSCGATAPRQ